MKRILFCILAVLVLVGFDFDRARQSTVVVITPTGYGTGVVVQQGVLTCAHVLALEEGGHRRKAQVLVAGEKKPRNATVARIDPKRDLALLVSHRLRVPVTPLSKTQPRVGDTVYTVGNSFGRQGSVKTGIISGDYSPEEYILDVDVLPGDSGGPLLNTRGELIGINRAFDFEFPLIGYGYASNLNTIRDFLK